MYERIMLIISVFHILFTNTPCQSADLQVASEGSNEVLQYNGTTDDFVDVSTPMKNGCSSIQERRTTAVLPPTITITNPTAGTVWEAGTTQMITWDSDMFEGDVGAYLVTGRGDWFWINEAPVSTGEMSWDICPSIGDAIDYSIHLFLWTNSTQPVLAESEPFEISNSLPAPSLTLTSPNGGDVWEAGTTHTVTWDSTSAVGNVHVFLFKGGELWKNIGFDHNIGSAPTAPMTNGQLNWEICPYIDDGEDYTLRIEWVDCGLAVVDENDMPFEIIGYLPWPAILGDADANGIVDLDDFSLLTACFKGSENGWAGCVCGQFDFDQDGDIDLNDIAAFQMNFDGSM